MRAAVVRARIERTRAIAATGLRPPPPPAAGGEERRASVPVTLCPADDWHRSGSGARLGPLQVRREERGGRRRSLPD